VPDVLGAPVACNLVKVRAECFIYRRIG